MIDNNKIILGSNNQGKIQEFNKLFSNIDLKIIPQKEFNIQDIEETGLSFVENAILKARNASKYSNLPAISDDSGIIVDVLKTEPGIYSARYAGDNSDSRDNINKLLSKLKDIKINNKLSDAIPEVITSKFICVIVFVNNYLDPLPEIFMGEWKGSIVLEPKGLNGFGYDPIFFCKDYNCTAAELDPKIKNKISHRAQAVNKLKLFLNEKYKHK